MKILRQNRRSIKSALLFVRNVIIYQRECVERVAVLWNYVQQSHIIPVPMESGRILRKGRICICISGVFSVI